MSRNNLPKLKTWLEVCTHNEGDWREYMSLCAKSFQNAAFAKRFLPDVEKRKKFLPHYFNYCYETMYSGGRAGLVCLKALPEGHKKSEIVMGALNVYKPNAITKSDPSLMMNTYKHGAESLMKRDVWYNDNIHGPMKKAAESLSTVAWYGCRQAVSQKYRNQGFGMKYMLQIYKMLFDEGLRLSGINSDEKKMLPVVYGLQVELSLMKTRFMSSVNSVEVGHLHYNYEPELKCCQDPSAKEGDKFSCIFVMIYKPNEKYDPMIPQIRKYLN